VEASSVPVDVWIKINLPIMTCAKNARAREKTMKILVTPREFAQQISKRKRTKGLAVISICSCKRDIIFNKSVRERMSCEDILTLIFADLTTEDYKIAPNLITKFPAFNEKKARETIIFFNK